jgi:ribonuclease HI
MPSTPSERAPADVPWVHAQLRGKEVLARADGQGRLTAQAGRVEVRYNPRDGRKYSAAAKNLVIGSGPILPDDACGPAEAVRSEKSPNGSPAKPRNRAKSEGQVASPPRPGEVVAYTDGACSGNPGPAGLGVVVVDGARAVERFEYLGTATNNIAELTAILRAVEEVAPAQPLVVYTDSRYAIGVLQQGWKAKANQALIADIRAALAGRPVRLVYVPGHSGVALNERADELARRAISERSSKRRTLTKEAPDGSDP